MLKIFETQAQQNKPDLRNKEFGLVVSCPTNLLCDFQKIIHRFSPQFPPPKNDGYILNAKKNYFTFFI